MPVSDTYILQVQLQLADMLSEGLERVKETIQPVINQAKQLKDAIAAVGIKGGAGIENVTAKTKAAHSAISMSLKATDQLEDHFQAISKVDFTNIRDIEAAKKALSGIEQVTQNLLLQGDELSAQDTKALLQIDKKLKLYETKEMKHLQKVAEFQDSNLKVTGQIMDKLRAGVPLSNKELGIAKNRHKLMASFLETGNKIAGVTKDEIGEMGNLLELDDQRRTAAAKLNEQLGKHSAWLGKIGAQSGVAFSDFARAVATGTAAMLFFKTVMGDLIDMQEEFRLASFRVGGSLADVQTRAFALQGQLGLTTKEAMAVQKAFAAVGASKDEIEELQIANAMFTKATGASSAAAALLQRRITALTGSSEAANDAINTMTVASRKLGLTSQELDSIMGKLEKTIIGVNAQYGKGAAKQFSQALTGVAGAAKRAGVSAESVTDSMTRVLEEPYDFMLLFGGKFNETMNAMGKGDAGTAFEIIGKQAEIAMAKVEKAPYALRRMRAEIYGMPIEQLKSLAEASKAGGLAMIDSKDATDVFNESMQTLAQSFNILVGTVKQIAGTILGPLLQALTKVLWPVVKLVQGISWLFTGLNNLIGRLGEGYQGIARFAVAIGMLSAISAVFTGKLALLGPGIVTVTRFLFGWTAGIWKNIAANKVLIWTQTNLKKFLGFLIAPYGALIAKMKGFVGGQGKLGDAAKKASGVMKASTDKIKEGMSGVAKQGAATQVGMNKAGSGFANFFKVFKKISFADILKMALILGILVGAIWLLVLAARELKDAKLAFVILTAGLIGLGIGIYFLVPALVALGTIGWVGVAAMAALAVVALALGFAVKLVVDSFTAFIGSLGIGVENFKGAAIGMIGMAGALFVLGQAMAAFRVATFFTGNVFAKLGKSVKSFTATLAATDLSMLMATVTAITGLVVLATQMGDAATGVLAMSVGFVAIADSLSRFRTMSESLGDPLRRMTDSIVRMGESLRGVKFEFLGDPLKRMTDSIAKMGESLGGIRFDQMTVALQTIEGLDTSKVDEATQSINRLALAARSTTAGEAAGGLTGLTGQIETLHTVKFTKETAREMEKEKIERERNHLLVNLVDSVRRILGMGDPTVIKKISEDVDVIATEASREKSDLQITVNSYDSV